jgi:hypothetical protein
MDTKTRNALARIAIEWQKQTSSRVGQATDSNRRRTSNNTDTASMSPGSTSLSSTSLSSTSQIALRHRRYQQLIQLRKAS